MVSAVANQSKHCFKYILIWFIEFRRIIKKLRAKRKRFEYGCLPFDFNVMLEYLSDKSKREQLSDEIDDYGILSTNMENTITKYLGLFEANLESMERGIADQ